MGLWNYFAKKKNKKKVKKIPKKNQSKSSFERVFDAMQEQKDRAKKIERILGR